MPKGEPLYKKQCSIATFFRPCTYNENRIDYATTKGVRIPLLLNVVVGLPSGLVHEVHCTEFSTHPSKMVAAWRSVALPYDLECVCIKS